MVAVSYKRSHLLDPSSHRMEGGDLPASLHGMFGAGSRGSTTGSHLQPRRESAGKSDLAGGGGKYDRPHWIVTAPPWGYHPKRRIRTLRYSPSQAGVGVDLQG